MPKEPKIIIILRIPIDKAFSAYNHRRIAGIESQSFEKVIKDEGKNRVYITIGFYYKQVKAYLNNFSQVKVYLFDDLKKDTLGLVQDIYHFLSVDSSFVPKSIERRYNPSGIPKNKLLYDFLIKPLSSIL